MKQVAKKTKKTQEKKKPGISTGQTDVPLRRAAPKANGSVTLAQARALVRAQAPKRAPRRQGGIPPASPGTVGLERRKLELQRRDENERRIREYKATLAIMKRRGVKGLTPKTSGALKRRAPAVGAVTGAQPLQIFAEGDSWFDYPVPFFGGGIIPRLENLLGVPILNLAKAGDEVRYMLGVEERKVLAKQLKNGCPAGGPWDMLIFSGGGNDIVDNPMALWIKDYDPAIPPANLIHKTRFDAALALVRAGYEDLIGLRNTLSPGTRLVFHAYDFAIPDGRGICHLGPWLKPTFDLRKFPTRAAMFDVVKAMLQQFAALLQSLETSHGGVTFINGQGTLAPKTSSWHNELHPSKDGFKKFAAVFQKTVKSLFPNRVI
ncbi:MAG: hypothetical protein R3B95_19330 [Nitrospirales bacterium]|nr:hypothetical protein [Nitrospirales bacterium]